MVIFQNGPGWLCPISTALKQTCVEVQVFASSCISKPRVPGRVHGILTFAQICVPGYTKFGFFFLIFLRKNLVIFTSFWNSIINIFSQKNLKTRIWAKVKIPCTRPGTRGFEMQDDAKTWTSTHVCFLVYSFGYTRFWGKKIHNFFFLFFYLKWPNSSKFFAKILA